MPSESLINFFRFNRNMTDEYAEFLTVQGERQILYNISL